MSLRPLVGVAALALCAGAAVATNTKIKDFHAAGAGLTSNPGTDGMAKFKEATDPNLGSGLRVHLHMQDLQPNTTYGVAIYCTGVNPVDGADYSSPLAFTTNPAGNATFEAFLPTWDDQFLGAAPRIQVYVYDFDPCLDNISFVTPTELRAEGIGQ